MEQAQQEFLARKRLDAMECESRRKQRDLEAQRHVQELTDQLVRAETTRLDAERRAQDLEHERVQESRSAESRSLESENVLRLERQRIERLDSKPVERERLEAEYATRWQQRMAEASAELVRHAADVQQVLNAEMMALQKRSEPIVIARRKLPRTFSASQPPSCATSVQHWPKVKPGVGSPTLIQQLNHRPIPR
jgi:phosphoglycerate-specific signal transduction histidine kinase